MIDAHVHFYDPGRPEGIPHPTPDNRLLYRRMMPDDFRPLADTAGLTGVVMIECSPRPRDNAWAIALARTEPLIRAFVGHLDVTAADYSALLRNCARDPLFRGIRIRPGLLADPAVDRSLGLLVDLDLTLDVLLDEAELPALHRLARKLPALPIMVNHLGLGRPGPPDDPTRWSAALRKLAEQPAVFCKVSALTEAAPERPASSAATAYAGLISAAATAFGTERLVFGSNWPPCLQAGPYPATAGIIRRHFSPHGKDALAGIMGGNAARFYRGPRFPA